METTQDAVLGGRLRLAQPKGGHRFGHDAILLAAAVPAEAGDLCVEFGAGVGAAGLALAHRCRGVRLVLAEIDPALAALAEANAVANDLADRVRVVALDVTGPARDFAAHGLAGDSFDHVLMNPPYLDPARHRTGADKAGAHAATPDMLARWFASAGRLLVRGGTLTAILRADRLDEALIAARDGFGSVMVRPIHPAPGKPAIRIIVAMRRLAKGPLAILPGFDLADAAARPTARAEAVLRDGAGLDFDN
jgi:tRNA1(Val) A37 N6-methylase TrmN6